MLLTIFRKLLLAVIKRGNFKFSVFIFQQLLKLDNLLPKSAIAPLICASHSLQFKTVTDYAEQFSSRSDEEAKFYDFSNKNVLVFMESGSHKGLIKQYMSNAKSVDCYFEGSAQNLRSKGPIEYKSLSKTITAYDTGIGKNGIVRNTNYMIELKNYFNSLVEKYPSLNIYRKHGHALSQTVDAKFLQNTLSLEIIDHLLKKNNYDIVCVVVSEGTLASLSLEHISRQIPPEKLLIACGRARNIFDKRFYSLVKWQLDNRSLTFKKSIKKHIETHLPQKNSQAPDIEAPLGELSFETQKYSQTLSQYFEKPSSDIKRHIFYPFLSLNGPANEGFVELLNSIYGNELCVSLHPQFLSKSDIVKQDNLLSDLYESKTNIKFVFFDKSSSLSDEHSIALNVSQRFAKALLLSYMFSVKPLGDKANYVIFSDSKHFKAIVRDYAKCLVEIILADRFVAAVKPSSIITYPSALPFSRILSTISQKFGAIGIDIQPFFVMDEPRTLFHHEKNGSHILIQSEEFRSIYIKAGYASENILITGTPRTSMLLEKLKLQSSSTETIAEFLKFSKIILFADQITNEEQVYELLAFFAQHVERNPEHLIVYRPHYRQKHLSQGLLNTIKENPNIFLGTEQEIVPLIAHSDVTITYYSNVALEAAIMGKPVITFYTNDVRYPEPLNMNEWVISRKATGFDELGAIIDLCLYNSEYRKTLLDDQLQYLEKNPQYIKPIVSANIKKEFRKLLKQPHLTKER